MLARHRRRPVAGPAIDFDLVPNIFTVMSFCAGLTAIRYGLDQRFELALVLIVAAGVLDGLDGRSARLLKITSKLGAQLDSPADFLSFGVAPALLVYLWTLNQVKGVGWSLALLFATCCALRLARFNTELEDSKQPSWMSRFFTGLPAPAAAGCLIMPMLATFALDQTWPRSWRAERAGHAHRRRADGQPGADLLDQDDRGPGQAGRTASRPILIGVGLLAARVVECALAHPARGRRGLSGEPADQHRGRLAAGAANTPRRAVIGSPGAIAQGATRCGSCGWGLGQAAKRDSS